MNASVVCAWLIGVGGLYIFGLGMARKQIPLVIIGIVICCTAIIGYQRFAT